MLIKLFLAFTIIPIIEIYLLIKVGTVIGTLNTVLLVIVTGLAGAYLARQQGIQIMLRVRNNLQQGIMPGEEMTDALLVFLAGAVLITPGLVTDAFGLILLYPKTRFYFKRLIEKKFGQWIQKQDIHVTRYP